ncbi:MAG: tetratricopeptide repeat protein, partial [Rhodoferax sp.]
MKKTSLPSGPIFVSAAQIETKFQQAIQLHQHGQLVQAKALYESILAVQPKHAQSLHFLGVLAHQTGNLEPAIALIGRAIEVAPGQPAFYCNLGNVQLQLKRFQEAVTSYERAISIKPDFADAHANLGTAFAELKRFGDALDSYNRAIAFQPNHPNAFYNRGNALLALDKVEAAVTSFQKAISLQPGFATAHCSLGAAFLTQGKLEEAINCARKALSINPNLAEAHGNLASALLEQGKSAEAMPWFANVIGLAETVTAKAGFVRCVRRVTFNEANPTIQTLLVRAITEAWTRPSNLRVPAISLVKQNPSIKRCLERVVSAWPKRLSIAELFGDSDLETIAEDPLLLCMLECIPIASVEFERFVTLTRKVMLDLVVNAEDLTLLEYVPPANILTFCCAVARQCFVSEYVYACAEEEREQSEALLLALTETLVAKVPVPAHWLAVAATYASLGSLPCVDAILEKMWPAPVNELLKQQLLEPLQEQSLRANIPAITPIEDSVSLLVQTQYEENPYPRWFRTPAFIEPVSVNVFFSNKFPKSAFQSIEQKDDVDILIA